MNEEKQLEAGEASTPTNKDMTLQPGSIINRGISFLEFALRFVAVFGTIGSALAMGTSQESVPSLTQLVLLNVKYNHLPTLTFFVIANSVAGAYLVLSLLVSIYHITCNEVKITRIILLAFDTAMLALVSAGASAATATVYLAHEGNNSANWPAICRQFGSFCERISGSLIGSFSALILFILIIVASAFSLSRP